MTPNKSSRQNRVREALGKIYDQEPPHFREYLRRFRDDPTSRVFAPLAEAYRRLGRVEEAIALCEEGLEHHPDFHGGRVALAKCFIDKKRYNEAKTELERVVAAVPENLLSQRLLGEVNLALGQRAAALHCFKMALLLVPNDVALSEKVHALEREVAEGLAGLDAETDVVTDFAPELDEPGETTPQAAQAPAAPAAPTDLGDDALQREVEALLNQPEAEAAPSAAASSEALWGPPSVAVEDDEAGELTGAGPGESRRPEAEQAELAAILGGGDEPDDEAFKIEHVRDIFNEGTPEKQREITTATLGDLYFQQGQFDKALRIFEKIQSQRPTPELSRKIHACRVKLGVDREALVRARKIEALKSILKRLHS